jgi:hypothetical protein
MLFFLLLSFFSLGLGNLYDHNISYYHAFYPENNTMYFNSDNTNNHLFTSNNLTDCKNNCNQNVYCNAIFSIEDTEFKCYGLDIIGPEVYTELNTNTYIKHIRKSYNSTNNSIEGYVIGDPFSVYLDINHNDRFDPDEPSDFPVNEYFHIDNLDAGNYIIRQNISGHCYQYYPPYEGIKYGTLIGDGYADVVLEYFDNSGGPVNGPYGGDLSTGASNVPVSVDYILGNNQNTYISIPRGSYIIVGFNDETILNTPGNDIFIGEIGLGGTESADIYVSNNMIDYTYLGEASSNRENSFDLSTINYNLPVNSIKIVGKDNGYGSWIGFDVNYVRAYHSSMGPPSFGYLIGIPNDDILVFLNECGYQMTCHDHCTMSSFTTTIDNYNSCEDGCQIFINSTDFSLCNDNIYCKMGLEYGINQRYYQEFNVHYNSKLPNPYLIEPCIDCRENVTQTCLDDLACYGVSFINNTVSWYNMSNMEYSILFHNMSVLLLKQDMITTTGTTSQTLTITSTPTTSQTSTFTSTPSTSQTSTFTSTLTTSQTSTLTTSQTTSLTTTSLTTSQTTSSTTSPTTSPTTSQQLNNVINNSSQINSTEIVLIVLLVIVLVIVIGIILFNIKKNRQSPPSRPGGSFENPIYGMDDSIDLGQNDEIYYPEVNVETNYINSEYTEGEYLDISHVTNSESDL